MVRQFAEVENNMNSVERIINYSEEIEQEAPYELPDSRPPKQWPSDGRIEFSEVVLKYRQELPPVLKGLSLNIEPGEKIGIVGRYEPFLFALNFGAGPELHQDWGRKIISNGRSLSLG